MRSIWILCCVIGLAVLFQGCETLKGAKTGFQKDIEQMKSRENAIYKADDWMREHLW